MKEAKGGERETYVGICRQHQFRPNNKWLYTSYIDCCVELYKLRFQYSCRSEYKLKRKKVRCMPWGSNTKLVESKEAKQKKTFQQKREKNVQKTKKGKKKNTHIQLHTP